MNGIYYVYIMTNIHNTVFYTGITNDLLRRTDEHISPDEKGFTQRYHVAKVVWYEMFPDPATAIAAEKKIKGWTRKKKIALVKNSNPVFADLIKGEREEKDSSATPQNDGRESKEKILHFVQDDGGDEEEERILREAQDAGLPRDAKSCFLW